MRKQWINTVCAAMLVSGATGLVAAPPAFAESAAYARSDGEFVEHARAINELELRLGRLATERGVSSDIKAMGQKMLQKHTELGQQLADLAKQLGAAQAVALSPDDRATLDRVTAQSAATFDAVFKRTVDDIHRRELTLYRDEVGRASNTNLRELAQRRVAKLEETIAQAEKASHSAKKQDW
jgi:putative membrane protein